MKENKTTVRGGIGFTGLLTIAFIVLKLLGKISWIWLWVLAPLWIGAILWLLLFAIIFIASATEG